MTKIWIEYLRVIGVIAVITTHVSASVYNDFHLVEIHNWWFANILNTSSRFAVPLFIMISGCLILGRKIQINTFYSKKISRLLYPFIFWSIFFAIFTLFRKDLDLNYLVTTLSIDLFVTGNTFFHLWYLPMFACLMLFAPFINLGIIGEKMGHKDFCYFFFLIVIFMFIQQISLIAESVFTITINWHKEFPWYIGYFILGYFIDFYRDRIKVSNFVTVTTIILIISLSSLLNYYSVASLNIIKDYLILNNTSILNFLLTLSIFYLFVNNKEFFKSRKLISNIAAMSFGIYLIHPFCLVIFRKVLSLLTTNITVTMPLLILLTLISSYFITILISKVKFGRLIC